MHLFFCFIAASKKKPAVTLYVLPENLPARPEFIRFPFYFSCDHRQQYCQTCFHYVIRIPVFSKFPITFSSLSFKPSRVVSSRLFPGLANSLHEILSDLLNHWVSKPVENALGFYYSSATLTESNSFCLDVQHKLLHILCGLKPEPSYYYPSWFCRSGTIARDGPSLLHDI